MHEYPIFDNLWKFILKNMRGQLTRSIFQMPIFILEFNLILFYHFKFKVNIKKIFILYLLYSYSNREFNIQLSDMKRI